MDPFRITGNERFVDGAIAKSLVIAPPAVDHGLFTVLLVKDSCPAADALQNGDHGFPLF